MATVDKEPAGGETVDEGNADADGPTERLVVREQLRHLLVRIQSGRGLTIQDLSLCTLRFLRFCRASERAELLNHLLNADDSLPARRAGQVILQSIGYGETLSNIQKRHFFLGLDLLLPQLEARLFGLCETESDARTLAESIVKALLNKIILGLDNPLLKDKCLDEHISEYNLLKIVRHAGSKELDYLLQVLQNLGKVSPYIRDLIIPKLTKLSQPALAYGRIAPRIEWLSPPEERD